MKMQVPELPDWQFDLDEVSAGVYKVVATDRDGHVVQMTGTDPDALLAEARKAAHQRKDNRS